ncbi:hypothetical protein [Ruegeria sp. HKCCA5763]|uniref:hypothetical protein n=1 Tax=Ruegeria sp. HKCCA5763 TaxID=2682987 RepID=UPI00148A0B44|nr:hypothetical protein [Ruegeria sp. HKCCA5763]
MLKQTQGQADRRFFSTSQLVSTISCRMVFTFRTGLRRLSNLVIFDKVKRAAPVMILVFVLFTILGACERERPKPSGELNPQRLLAAVKNGEGIDPSKYKGDIEFLLPSEVPVGNEVFNVAFFIGLSPATETRLRVTAMADLRAIQARFPELASGVYDDSCSREVSVKIHETEAIEDHVELRGSMFVRFFSCSQNASGEERGGLWLTQEIDTKAKVEAFVEAQCVRFSVVELELDPRGFTGFIAKMFGVIEEARTEILEQAENYFDANPICLTVPKELKPVSPKATLVRALEIGEGGIGAEIQGSIDTDATTLVNLLSVMELSDIIEGQQ